MEQVLEGVLDATFIYPTGGDKVMQVAMDILEKRPYERDTKLSTALVDKTNSRVMQVQTFRKVGGYSYASTMCIGNLRSGTAAFSLYLREKRPEQIRQALYYFGIILFFAVGAGIGGNLSVRYGFHVIWISGGLLLISFLLMFLEKIR